jgi:hypothetical protein
MAARPKPTQARRLFIPNSNIDAFRAFRASPACRVPGADLVVKNVDFDQNIAQSFQCLSKFAWSVTIPVQRLQW